MATIKLGQFVFTTSEPSANRPIAPKPREDKPLDQFTDFSTMSDDELEMFNQRVLNISNDYNMAGAGIATGIQRASEASAEAESQLGLGVASPQDVIKQTEDIAKSLLSDFNNLPIDNPKLSAFLQENFQSHVGTQMEEIKTHARGVAVDQATSSVQEAVKELANRASIATPEESASIRQQITGLLDSAAEDGILSPEHASALGGEMSKHITLGAYHNTVSNDPAFALQMLNTKSHKELGITKEEHADLQERARETQRDIEFDEIDGAIQDKIISEQEKRELALDHRLKLVQDELDFATLSASKGTIGEGEYESLNDMLTQQLKEKGKMAPKLLGVLEKVKNGEVITSDKKAVAGVYNQLLKNREAMLQRPLTFAEKAQIAATFKTNKLSPFTEELGLRIMAGSAEEKVEAFQVYEALSQNNSYLLDKLPKEAHTKGAMVKRRVGFGLSLGDAVKQVDSLTSELTEEQRKLRTSQYNKLLRDDPDTVNDLLDDSFQGSLTVGGMELPFSDDIENWTPEARNAFTEIVRSNYITNNGSIEDAVSSAKEQLRGTMGVTQYSPSPIVTSFAPELVSGTSKDKLDIFIKDFLKSKGLKDFDLDRVVLEPVLERLDNTGSMRYRIIDREGKVGTEEGGVLGVIANDLVIGPEGVEKRAKERKLEMAQAKRKELLKTENMTLEERVNQRAEESKGKEQRDPLFSMNTLDKLTEKVSSEAFNIFSRISGLRGSKDMERIIENAQKEVLGSVPQGPVEQIVHDQYTDPTRLEKAVMAYDEAINLQPESDIATIASAANGIIDKVITEPKGDYKKAIKEYLDKVNGAGKAKLPGRGIKNLSDKRIAKIIEFATDPSNIKDKTPTEYKKELNKVIKKADKTDPKELDQMQSSLRSLYRVEQLLIDGGKLEEAEQVGIQISELQNKLNDINIGMANRKSTKKERREFDKQLLSVLKALQPKKEKPKKEKPKEKK